MATVLRAYRYRFYPTYEQAAPLARTFGCVRYIFKDQARYPSFKKKRGKQSATYMVNGFRWREGQLWLAKQKDPPNIRWSRHLNWCDCSPPSNGRGFTRIFANWSGHPGKPHNGGIGGVHHQEDATTVH